MIELVQRQSSLGRAPQSLVQIYQQARACHHAGRFWEAEQLYKRVLRADDRNFAAAYQLGLLHLRQRKFEDAERWFRRAIAIDRNIAEAYHHLGLVLIELKRPKEAVEHYRKALAIEPGVAETHNNLGHALQTLDRLEEAMGHFQNALAIDPTLPEAHNNMGNVLATLGRDAEAIPYYEHAIASNPKDPRPRVSLGNALERLGRTDEALAQCRDMLAVRPEDPGPRNQIGRLLQSLGRADEAIREFEDAIATVPKQGAAYWNLANARKLLQSDPIFITMEELLGDAGLDVENRIPLHFALAKAFADVGDRQQSIHHLRRGNSLKRQQTDYNEAKTLAGLELVRASFTAKLLREKAGLGHASPVPVFIIGMPRSGTTLIEQILASHPQTFGAGELPNIAALARSVGKPGEAEWQEAISSVSAQQLRDLGERYEQTIRALAPNAERITDKMPVNFAYAGFIHLILPHARIIHARRDPCDTALSCFSLLFTHGQEFSYDMAELGRYYRAYETLMEHWRKVLPPGAMLEVQYEEVIADLEGQARRIVAYCGLEFDVACLAFHTTERPVRTASATQVRRPIYRSSVGRKEGYEELLQPFVAAMGVSNDRSL